MVINLKKYILCKTVLTLNRVESRSHDTELTLKSGMNSTYFAPLLIKTKSSPRTNISSI